MLNMSKTVLLNFPPKPALLSFFPISENTFQPTAQAKNLDVSLLHHVLPLILIF